MDRRPCPNDAMFIPKAAEVRLHAGAVHFFWCWSCQELFAFVGDPGRFAAGFARAGPDGWQVFRAGSAGRDLELAVAAVAQVGPQGPGGPAG